MSQSPRPLTDILRDLIHEASHLHRLAPQENLSPPMLVACEQVTAAADELGLALLDLTIHDTTEAAATSAAETPSPQKGS